MVKEKEGSRRSHRSHRSHTSQEPKAKSHRARTEKKKKSGKTCLPFAIMRRSQKPVCKFLAMPWSENCKAAHLIECVFMRG